MACKSKYTHKQACKLIISKKTGKFYSRNFETSKFIRECKSTTCMTKIFILKVVFGISEYGFDMKVIRYPLNEFDDTLKIKDPTKFLFIMLWKVN